MKTQTQTAWGTGNPVPEILVVDLVFLCDNPLSQKKLDLVSFFLFALKKPQYFCGKMTIKDQGWWGWLDSGFKTLEQVDLWCSKYDPLWDYIYKVERGRCKFVYNRFFGNRNVLESLTATNKKCPKCGGTGNKSMGIIPFVPCDCKTKS